MTGMIFDIKEMAVHDGPGIRTTVFLKGCPLRCKWCHNPEGLIREPQLMYKKARCTHCGLCRKDCGHEPCESFGRCVHVCPEGCLEISGREVGAEELCAELLKNAQTLGESYGGVTFSGGEPLMQSQFLSETADRLREKNVHLCIETSGYAKKEDFCTVIGKMDFVIMDIKLADTEMHKKFTGVGNERIIENFAALKESGKPYIIRTPLIPKITDTEENLSAVKRIIGESEWEQLPYNSAAGAKYEMLDMKYPMNAEGIL